MAQDVFPTCGRSSSHPCVDNHVNFRVATHTRYPFTFFSLSSCLGRFLPFIQYVSLSFLSFFVSLSLFLVLFVSLSLSCPFCLSLSLSFIFMPLSLFLSFKSLFLSFLSLSLFPSLRFPYLSLSIMSLLLLLSFVFLCLSLSLPHFHSFKSISFSLSLHISLPYVNF